MPNRNSILDPRPIASNPLFIPKPTYNGGGDVRKPACSTEAGSPPMKIRHQEDFKINGSPVDHGPSHDCTQQK